MEDLAKMVEEILSNEVPAAKVQSVQVEAGLRLVDELVSRGLLDAPTYKLAPITSIPCKVAFA